MSKQKQSVLEQLDAECKNKKAEYIELFAKEMGKFFETATSSQERNIDSSLRRIWDSSKGQKNFNDVVTSRINNLLKKEDRECIIKCVSRKTYTL